MLFKAVLVVRQTHALVPKAKPPRDGENLRFFLTKSATPPPLKSQSMQHLRKQVIRSFKIEGGVHDLLQRQPIKNGEQESS
jgi:hypothetical protein